MSWLRAFFCFSLVAVSIWNVPAAVSQSTPKASLATSPPKPSLASNSATLSPEVLQVAQSIGISDKLETLMNGGGADSIALRQELTEIVLTASLEVRAGVGAIDVEVAQADDLRAILERRRDKALKLTALANLVTGTFNGITGNSLDLASRDLLLPSQILEVAEGATQTGLAALALQEQRGERHIVEPMGSMLARFFEKSAGNTDFPDAVWTYLNTVPPGKSVTRRDALVNSWTKMGIIRRHRQSHWDTRLGHLTKGGELRINIDVLADRDAMLHDLRAVVSEMDIQLLQIMRVIRRSR